MKATEFHKSLRNGAHATIYELVRDPKLHNRDRIAEGGDKRVFPFVEGSSYNGEWKDDMKHGFGTLIYPDGTKYEGDWSMNKRHGNGTLWIKEGKKSVKQYVGCWREGVMEGFGTFHYENGEVYKGEWVRNQREGNGRLEYPNGDFFVGEWVNNLQHGIGTFHLSNGNIFEGMYLNGKRDGAGKFFYASTLKVYEGEWVLDQPKCGEYREPTTNEMHRFGQSVVRKEVFSLPALCLDKPRAVLDVATAQARQQRAERLGSLGGASFTTSALSAAEAVFERLDSHGTGVLSLWVLGDVFLELGLTLTTRNLHEVAQQLDLGNFATLSFPETVDVALSIINGEAIDTSQFNFRK